MSNGSLKRRIERLEEWLKEKARNKEVVYEEMENTATSYLGYMQQKSAEAFTALKEELSDG